MNLLKVMRFFELFASWPWPQPVALTNYASVSNLSGGRSTPDGEHTCASASKESAESVMNGLLAGLQQGLQRQQQLQQQHLLLAQSLQGGHSSWNPEVNPQERHQVTKSNILKR